MGREVAAKEKAADIGMRLSPNSLCIHLTNIFKLLLDNMVQDAKILQSPIHGLCVRGK